MELEKIKELVDMMKANDLSEIEIVDGQTRIMLKRGAGQQITPQVLAMPSVVSPSVNGFIPNGLASAETSPHVTQTPSQDSKQKKMAEIVAPLVGTIYMAPSPSSDPFVQVGDPIDEDQVVCIIEAMKVMNEIKSEVKGTIKEILVKNGQAVEYAQPMFLVEPD
ncbi:MAG: acetyl-CoA carboxylase biotin carboxyl carrier protein [Sedimentisphaerales bacterium]|nr:acetyl-CoA carboxylase biotin carboxyl carrier protein [Sedimentisphaerales bacterium]